MRLGDRGGGEAGAESGGGDDVVATGMADAGEGVVFAADGDRRTGGSHAGIECRRHVVGALIDRDPLVGEHAGEQLVGEVLLEVELGVGVDRVGDLEQASASAGRSRRGPSASPR